MDNWKWVRSQFQPPKFASWQTLMLTSWGIWLISLALVLAEPSFQLADSPITRLGWVVFLFALAWWQSSNPWKILGISLGPGIVAAVLCTMFFRDESGRVPRWAFVAFPLVTSTIAVLPSFVGKQRNFKIPSVEKRPALLLRGLIATVFSCWIYFTFLLQDWVADYPGVRLADLTESNFIVRVASPSQLRGYAIARTVEVFLEKHFKDRSWSEIEKILLNVRADPNLVRRNLEPEIQQIQGDRPWDISLRVGGNGRDEYRLFVQLYWERYWLDENGQTITLMCRVKRQEVPPAIEAQQRDTTGSLQCNTDTQAIFTPYTVFEESQPES
ncbi:hypothetical protein AY599_06790 [Leptolyngbya valderiana BDU 20041]|uniref:DUF5357 family protein n=1 Tax=Baaleninema simplex TaxID=2862350 RepID=UPI00034B0FC1|nr:DUF5357 family protein [Baaleninema simplex]MDC0831972.1 DUF5357 family protein [Geitlerinema sp. CS-897]OAB55896.1 hypothetical protein AY599_06790 [Leptolyngbya valderiana BDU 20041]PPT09402.1 ABC-type sugar transport system permease component [Geitlerinema sp. FC II]